MADSVLRHNRGRTNFVFFFGAKNTFLFFSLSAEKHALVYFRCTFFFSTNMVVKITDFAGFAAEWLPRPLVYCFAQANAL